MSDRSAVAIEAMKAGIAVAENTNVLPLSITSAFPRFWDSQVQPFGMGRTRHSTRKSCHVYAVRCVHTNTGETSYKVGISDNPLRRSKSYSSTTPPGFDVELFRAVLVESRERAELIERSVLVAAFRAGMWSHGEWLRGGTEEPTHDR